MKEFILAIVVMVVLGVIFGVLIAILSKVLYVKEDNRIEKITSMLPGYNCGACGKSGCKGLATAIIEEGVSPDYCRPIKKEQLEVIKEYLKKALSESNDANNK